MLEFLCEFDGGEQVESRAQAQAEPVQIDQFEEQPERVVVGEKKDPSMSRSLISGSKFCVTRPCPIPSVTLPLPPSLLSLTCPSDWM